MKIGYARVSTSAQNLDMQVSALVYSDTLVMKEMLDKMHLQKIDMADEIFVINVGGYIGESTRREIAHAEQTGKPVRYLESI